MASAAEMFAFVSNFGPMLGELAADVKYLGERVAELEQRLAMTPPPAPGAAETEQATEDDSIEIPGVGKLDLGAMLKGAIPGGGDPASLFKGAVNWKPKQTTPPAPAAPTSGSSPAPATPTSEAH